MNLAITGAHSMGKSTLVQDWVKTHPNTLLEDEPYRVLGLNGPYTIQFRDAATRHHNGLMLYYNIGRCYRHGQRKQPVIFDRCPIDFIAYSQFAADCGRSDIDDAFVESMLEPTLECLSSLDLLVFIPKTDEAPVTLEDDGIRPIDHAYRDAMDLIFKQIYREGRYGLRNSTTFPPLIELWGSREERLIKLEQAIAAL
jgi:nicotinamide riboside kinase